MNKTIREHTDDLLKNLDILKEFGYIKSKRVYDLVESACEYHDYGKVNGEFQKRIKSKHKVTFDDNTEVVHNVLSLYFIDKKKFSNIEDYYRVGFAVLNHHNYCNNFKAIEDKSKKRLIEELLDEFETFKVTRGLTRGLFNMMQDGETILVKGLLHKCDYSASGENIVEYKNNFLSNGLDYLMSKWKNENSSAHWNTLQRFCKENMNENIIVIAQTGMGKTEAGLHWIGDNKGFFILPLRTAINAIYERIKKDIVGGAGIESKLALLHSDALSYYNNDNNSNEMDIVDYYRHSKQLAMPLSISTIDQLFDFVFKYNGYEMKLATLSYSKIVIDEIQMYGPDILAYLISGIKKIHQLGGKFAILTATLPPFIKDLIIDNGISFKEGTFVNDLKRHNIKTFNRQLDSDTIYKKFEENEKIGLDNKILVVCNTVKKAQQIYKELEEKNIPNVNILHSKFIKCDRAKKEREILEFGETKNHGKGIWVTTQIVEASLDIDFDYLFTELSELSGLFQRLGRCNRRGTKSVDEPNCFVFLDIDKGLLINGNKGFIDKKIYSLSKKALLEENSNGVLTEEKKVKIINKYLTTDNLQGSDYIVKYNELTMKIENLAPYEIDKKDVKFRNIISFDVIPESIYVKNKSIIDASSELLLNESIDKLEKVKLREEIKKYTLAVGIYDIRRELIVKDIKISNYESVEVIRCQYDELGFKAQGKQI